MIKDKRQSKYFWTISTSGYIAQNFTGIIYIAQNGKKALGDYCVNINLILLLFYTYVSQLKVREFS